MRRSLLLLPFSLLALLGTAPAAGAAAPAMAQGRLHEVSVVSVPAAVAHAAEAAVHIDWRRLGYDVTFVAQPTGRGQVRAYTDLASRSITVYVRPGQPAALTAKIFAYELGHAVDFTCLTPSTRRSYLAARGAVHTHWFAPDLSPEQRYGSGDLADTFSAWATHSTPYYSSTVGPVPTPAALRALRAYWSCTR